MSMDITRNRIEAILSGVPHYVDKVQDLWQIRVGDEGGARKDGAGLAEELLAKHRAKQFEFIHTEIAHPEPVSVSGEAKRGEAAEVELQTPPPNPQVIENPETQERLAEALRKLSEAEAKLEAKKAGTDIPPPEIADLIRLNENYERTNERLVTGYREAMQRAELARTRDGIFEGKSTTEWLRKADRYDSAIRWNKGRSAETI